MLPRPSWSGQLRLSLVSVPVQAINAESPEGEVSLHQLHSKCHNRIQYRKVCPEHGEVPNNEIVYAYEREKGEYVVLTKEEARRRKATGDKDIEIQSFVDPALIDASYFEGSIYYLLPGGKAAEKSYAVLLAAMADRGRVGIGIGQFWGKQRLVSLFAHDDYLGMRMLRFASQLRDAEEIVSEIDLPSANKEEVRLAGKLIDATTSKKLDLAAFNDSATDELRELIEAKTPRKQPKQAAASSDGPRTINLMDALRRSVAKSPATAKRTAGTRRRSTRRSAS